MTTTNTYLKIKFPNEYDEFLQRYDEDSPIIPLIQEFMSKLNIHRWFDPMWTDFCANKLNVKFNVNNNTIKFSFDGKYAKLCSVAFDKPIKQESLSFYNDIKSWAEIATDTYQFILFDEPNTEWEIDNPPQYIQNVITEINKHD